jgi:hypothetical protein
MEHVLLLVINHIHVFVQRIILALDVKYAIVHVRFIHVYIYHFSIKNLFEFNIILGLNGGVCRSTTIGGVVCTCPAGYTGVRWYVIKINFKTICFKWFIF